MPFQSAIRRFNGYGVPGEIPFDGPTPRIQTLPTGSTSAANNVFGRAFRNLAVSGGPASADLAAGGDVFAGVLCNPKEHASYGTINGGPLAPTLVLPNGVNAGFIVTGTVILITDALQAASPKIGDDLHYQITTGIIVTVAAGATPAGGYAKVPTGSVYHLPQQLTPLAGQLFVARI